MAPLALVKKKKKDVCGPMAHQAGSRSFYLKKKKTLTKRFRQFAFENMDKAAASSKVHINLRASERKKTENLCQH